MAKLTAKKRHALPKSDFAGPGESYPDDTEARARSALSRAAANAPPHVQAMIRAHVHHKYPGMKIAGLGRNKGAHDAK